MTSDERLIHLLLAWEDRRDRGEPVTPETLCADSPELRDELRRLVRALEGFAEALPAAPGADTGADAPFLLGPEARFRPARLRARGGLGEVHEATDAELDRRVALKRIRPDRAG